jgi:hypothetical protein
MRRGSYMDRVGDESSVRQVAVWRYGIRWTNRHSGTTLRAYHMTGDSASLGVIVQALNDRVAAWYQRYGIEPFPAHPLHLVIRMKDIRALFAIQEP